jgi:hypothetical protein
MKGDFSRVRFNRSKQYTAVLQQQGRVALDSDGNEQSTIYEYLRRTETVDVIGEYGGPIDDAGFGITVVGNTIVIGKGRYYVAGLTCENPTDLEYTAQTYYLDVAESDTNLLHELIRSGPNANIQVGLQVWQRLVTALEDPCLRDSALGQADTTARLQTVWRVVATLVRATEDKTTCCERMYRLKEEAHTGTLSAQTSGGTHDCGCQPVSSAGYRGLENQLYRVEVHQSGDETSATFKWSRENGSVVVAIQSVSGANVTVASLGPDANLGFQPGQWVEISDDTNLFGPMPNQPGKLYQIQAIDAPSLTVTMTSTVLPVDTASNARLRRWDQIGSAANAAGVALSPSWIDLENGTGNYIAGDWWTIPARTATGQIDWPPCGTDENAFQPPQYTRVYFAPLACIHLDPLPAASSPSTRGVLARARVNRFHVNDCRRLFPSLTELTGLADAQALHITALSWWNDDAMTLDDLIANGLTVTFDQAPDSLLTAANFIVKLETPIEFNPPGLTNLTNRLGFVAPGAVASPLGGAAAAINTASSPPSGTAATAGTASSPPSGTAAAAGTASSPPSGAVASAPGTLASHPGGTAAAPGAIAGPRGTLTIPVPIFRRELTPTTLRSEVVIDSTLQVLNNKITWTIPTQFVGGQQWQEIFALDIGLQNALRGGAGAPGRVRVKLLGHMLSASVGPNQLYLDGQTFSQTGTSANGLNQRIDLRLPSGDSRKASDFESWFYLYPILTVTSVQVTYSALTVDNSLGTPTIIQTTPPATTSPIVQYVTISLNYSPIRSTSLTLSLTGDATIASVPSTVQINPGELGVQVPVTITGAPPNNVTQTFTLTVSLSNALGFAASASASFTITGHTQTIIG